MQIARTSTIRWVILYGCHKKDGNSGFEELLRPAGCVGCGFIIQTRLIAADGRRTPDVEIPRLKGSSLTLEYRRQFKKYAILQCC